MKRLLIVVLVLLVAAVVSYVAIYRENPLPVVAEYIDGLNDEDASQNETPPLPNTQPVSYLECDFTEHAPAALEAVWQVITNRGIGTAFHVGNGRWLTAEHVIRGNRHVALARAGQTIRAEVVSSDRSGDTAILNTDSAPRSLSFGDLGEIGPGNHAYAVGFPLYEAPTAAVSRGVVSRFYQDPALSSIIQTDASVNPGNSGGPLLNECGQVIGMTVSKAAEDDAEGINYSIAAPVLEALLEGTQAPVVTARPAPTTTRPPSTTTRPPQHQQWNHYIIDEPDPDDPDVDSYNEWRFPSQNEAVWHWVVITCPGPIGYTGYEWEKEAGTYPPDGTAAVIQVRNTTTGESYVADGAFLNFDDGTVGVVFADSNEWLEIDNRVGGPGDSASHQVQIFVPGVAPRSAQFSYVPLLAAECDDAAQSAAPPTTTVPRPAPTTVPCPGVSQERWDALDEMEARYMADFDERMSMLEPGSRAWRSLNGSRTTMRSQFEAQRFEMLAEHDAYLQACALAQAGR